ncbi:MAG: LON peptidase substrate-binding domain-containing protein [Deltaproteobacteria bacterium]|nr:LON peptidase substrate-binding domain-containing protein [Deltaproteobacteria bacterium]
MGKPDPGASDPNGDAITPESLAALPIFPLPNCVLLPGGLLPLHVFEPRYRALTRDALAGDRLMAIARLKPGHEAEYFDRPPIHEHAGLGRILCADELPDGRFHILLRGVGRLSISSELPAERQYRRVSARLLEDRVSGRPERVRSAHLQLCMLCDRLADVLDEGGAQLRELIKAQTCAAACADVLTAALVQDPDDRQLLLETLDPADRLDRAIAHVARVLCELAPCTGAPN